MGWKFFVKVLPWFALLLVFAAACTRSASTPPPPPQDVVVVTEEVEVTREVPVTVVMPTFVPDAATAVDNPEPISIFADVNLDRYSYDNLAWCYENGYCEPVESVEGSLGLVSIGPERVMLVGDLYCSAVKFFHQDGEFEPAASTNLTFNDSGLYDHPDGSRYAACAEELARQFVLHEHFLCGWPNVHFACPLAEAGRTDGAIMIQTLAHTENLLYENEDYKGSRLAWPPRSNVFPDVSPARGLTLTEVKASEALESDGIWQQRGGSMEFGAEQKLTLEVWAEWLHSIFELFGPPAPVTNSPTPSPDSS